MRFTVALFLALTAPAIAQDTSKGFKTPSGFSHCVLIDLAQENEPSNIELRCDVAIVGTHLPAKPKDCDLEWGNAFIVKPQSAIGELACHGDTARNDELPILPYGTVWNQGGLTCKSERSGLTCLNAAHHGFRLSRRRQELF
jgi:hypothetical protein